MTDPDWTNDPPETIGEALADKHLRIIKEDVTMTDRLTDDDLAEIKARVEAFVKARYDYTVAINDNASFRRTPETKRAERQAQRAFNRIQKEFTIRAEIDIPALLAHIRAQDAANARLRDALEAMVDAEAHGIPGGYIGVDPSGETNDRHCTYCYTSWRYDEPERHDDDCPVAVARALNQRETEAVENALMQRINELESEVSKAATEYAMLLETNRAHLRERDELVVALRAALRTIEQLAAENPLTAHDTGIARALAASRALLDGADTPGEGGA